MKKLLRFLIYLIPASSLLADDDEKRSSIDDTFVTAKLWTGTLEDIRKAYHPNGGGDDDGVTIVEDEYGKRTIKIRRASKGFEWLSAQKMGIRAPGGQFTLLDQKVGEIVLRSRDGKKVSQANISIFNRGDDGTLKQSEYDELMQSWKMALDEKLKKRAEETHKAGAVKVDGYLWEKGRIAFLLEGSVNSKENRIEFVRLRMGYKDSLGGENEATRRGDLVKNVVKKENGDVLLPSVPMVDQGEKGYCVVASVERVARYYGLDVDQHELAQLANTDENGTYPDAMEKAFKKLTGKIHVRTLRLMDYDYKQTEKDFKAYQRLAKKEKAKVFDIDLDTHYVIAQGFWARLDPEVFIKVKVKQPKYAFFKNKTQEYINQGVPICWTLYLGMFKEGDMPQTRGGHMRLIVGYNEEKEEILYTDSWGEGHELKRMPASEAWCMTTGLYAMVPNK
ncbi:MAG: cysteine peptidase family C39 domain-containing protein [Akkermansiaceae bacterium]